MIPTRPPLILALDLSTRCGWACGRAGDRPDYGTIRIGGQREGGNLGLAFAGAVDAIADLHAVQHFERVVMEAPLPPAAQTHAHTARMQLGLAAVVELWCWRRDIPCTEASALTVRGKVIGRTRFGGRDEGKAAVIAWCEAQGWRPGDDNAADALLLLAYAQGVRAQPSLLAPDRRSSPAPVGAAA